MISSLVVVPGRPDGASHEGVLRHFGATGGRALGLSLLRNPVEGRDGVDVEMALIVCARLGFSLDHPELPIGLASAHWHHKHEDGVSALGKLQSPSAVYALNYTTW
ncbi:hypothetical protein [Amycolatopsis tucumanensis]|uniref:hypothetical protein n=1 Tax=Amycolatopsis tucumanensis TaxID=401106 RepID=UPI001F1957BA|nr:hypothetical protein [Amycolatopsis tucumanensis]MCF6424099.1 hypothetical protein [Amycolatopsis tucumanensis]